ncbi:MAG: DnaD domain protein [Clostridia bacterium]|nr:DnaD domain protein [Clostridia bacterium]
MSFCSFAGEAALFDVTPIENLFLIEHMFDAPAPALKVYLYARMLALHPELGDSLAEMARALRMGEEAVQEAFDYWERRGLVRRVADNPLAYELVMLHGQASASDRMEQKMYAYRDFHNQLQSLFGENMIDDREFRKAADWLNILGFDQAAVLRIVSYGISTSRVRSPKPASVFKRMDRVAEAWSMAGIHTLEEVERAIADETNIAPIAREVLKQLGIPRQPSLPELDCVRRWVEEWGCDQAQILSACGETTRARNPSFAYLEGILARQREDGGGLREPLVALLRELRPGSPQPSPEDERRYRALLDAGFSEDVIHLAAIQCHQVNRHSFDDLEWRLDLWRGAGLTTVAQVEAYTREMAASARQLRAVYKQAGYPDRRPGQAEIARYRAWRERYPEALIDFAAECAQGAGGSMAYMEKLLEGWQRDNISTVAEARAQHEARRASGARPAPANPALNYAQREYRDEDFGKDFYFDYDREFGDEEGQK